MTERIKQSWIDSKLKAVNSTLKDKNIDLEIVQKMGMLGYRFPLSQHKNNSGYYDVIYGTVGKWEQLTCLKGMQLVLDSLNNNKKLSRFETEIKEQYEEELYTND